MLSYSEPPIHGTSTDLWRYTHVPKKSRTKRRGISQSQVLKKSERHAFGLYTKLYRFRTKAWR